MTWAKAMPHVGCSGVAGPLPYRRMSWLRRLLGGSSDHEVKPQRLDYLSEALTLERQGDYDAALTSYKLALRDQPNDYRVLQNMAIAYSKTGTPRRGDATAIGARSTFSPNSPARTTASPFSCSNAATRAARTSQLGAIPRGSAEERRSRSLGTSRTTGARPASSAPAATTPDPDSRHALLDDRDLSDGNAALDAGL